MAEGVVKFFNLEKNFGFIVPDDGDAEVFVHASDVEGEPLQTGERVRYDPKPGYGNPKAARVRRIESDAAPSAAFEPPF